VCVCVCVCVCLCVFVCGGGQSQVVQASNHFVVSHLPQFGERQVLLLISSFFFSHLVYGAVRISDCHSMCTCVYTSVHVHVCVYMRTCVYTCAHASQDWWTCAHVCLRPCARVYDRDVLYEYEVYVFCVGNFLPLYLHTCTYMLAYIHAYMRKHACMCMYVARTYVYTHTYIQAYTCVSKHRPEAHHGTNIAIHALTSALLVSARSNTLATR
jgi:hypothetical protein